MEQLPAKVEMELQIQLVEQQPVMQQVAVVELIKGIQQLLVQAEIAVELQHLTTMLVLTVHHFLGMP
jgi:hypothetical protein